MARKYISNDISVDLDNSRMVDHNGKTGDARREAWVENDTEIAWVETNGEPEIYEDLTEALLALVPSSGRAGTGVALSGVPHSRIDNSGLRDWDWGSHNWHGPHGVRAKLIWFLESNGEDTSAARPIRATQIAHFISETLGGDPSDYDLHKLVRDELIISDEEIRQLGYARAERE